jgi:acyl transferase domain-containing protein
MDGPTQTRSGSARRQLAELQTGRQLEELQTFLRVRPPHLVLLEGPALVLETACYSILLKSKTETLNYYV